MSKFFPVSATSVTATTSSAATALPTPGQALRVTREVSAIRVFIAFGTSGVTATTSSTELVSGVVEEFTIPNPSAYSHFAVITNSGTCGVNVSVGPNYDQP